MIKKKILIVDDDQFVLNLIMQSFPNEEYQVFQANTVEEALKLYTQEAIDLVITDIIMPYEDGIALIDAIKKVDQNIPVIAISGGDLKQDNADQYIDFALYFADETLKKPFSKSDLLNAVENLLQNECSDFMQYL